jgi:hypothetical protein
MSEGTDIGHNQKNLSVAPVPPPIISSEVIGVELFSRNGSSIATPLSFTANVAVMIHSFVVEFLISNALIMYGTIDSDKCWWME